MITSTQFKTLRNEYLSNQAPQLVTELSNLQAIGDNNFSVNGVDFPVSDRALKSLDKIIGVKNPSLVKKTSGERGLSNIRNYFSTANSIDRAQKIVLVANPENKTVEEIIPLKQEHIPLEGFFDFVEFFAHQNNYNIDKIHISDSIVGGGNVYLRPQNPTFSKVMEGEEFMDNGVFLSWNNNQIEGGNFFERLICTNGAVELVKSKELSINSLSHDNIYRIAAALTNESIMRRGFEKYAQRLTERIGITASMAELQTAKHSLVSCGVPNETAELIVPHSALLDEFENQGINIKGREAMAKSNMTLWTLYNNLTQFATHNDIWRKDDMRRAKLIKESNYFLNKGIDITPYISVA